MSIQKQKLYNVIENLPEELSNKVMDYIEYLKFSYIMNNAPKELIIKDKNDLNQKLKEGIEDTEKGRVCTIEEAFGEIEELLTN